MIFLIALIVPLFNFLFQSYPRFFNKYFGIDVWMRIMEADLVRKNNHRIPLGKIGGNFILEGYFTYPPVLPWLLSYIPKKSLLNLQGFISPFFDSVHNFVVFFICYLLTGRLDISILAQIILATIPLIVLENSYLTPRSLGYLNFTLAFYPIFYYSIDPNLYYLITGFIFTVIIFFTHRFATQSLLFVSIFFTILDRSSLYLAVFFMAMITAIIVSKGYYIRILRGQLLIIDFWITYYQYRFAHQIRGLVTKKKDDFVSFVYYLLSTFTPISLIGTNPWLLIVGFYLIGNIFNFAYVPTLNPIFYKMSLWVLFFYVLSSLVLSIRFLIPIGEGQRYLEMALAPTAILSSVLILTLINSTYRTQALAFLLIFFVFNIFITIFSQLKAVIQDKTRTLNKDIEKVFKYLNNMKPHPRIICIPHYTAPMYAYNTHVPVFMDVEVSNLKKIGEIYPVLKRSIKEIAKQYNLDTVVLNKNYATKKELKMSNNKVIFETEDTQIIRI